MRDCKFCHDGNLSHRFGPDYECVNGVLIDIDVAMEGPDPSTAFPPAPCNACRSCGGAGCKETGDCKACKGTGWKSGKEESQERLEEWRAQ